MRAVRGDCQHERLYRTREEYHVARRRARWPKISVMFGPSNPISPISTINLPHIPHNLNSTTLLTMFSSVFSVDSRWLTPPFPSLALDLYGNSVRLNLHSHPYPLTKLEQPLRLIRGTYATNIEPVLSGLNGIFRNARTTFMGSYRGFFGTCAFSWGGGLLEVGGI